jgi:glucose-1-phosphate cytidylyltransferase
MHMREYSEAIPKPMVPIGYRSILWHVIKYYPTLGTRISFCAWGTAGTRSRSISLNTTSICPTISCSPKGQEPGIVEQRHHDDWNITFVDTGLSSNIGQRLKAVQEY